MSKEIIENPLCALSKEGQAPWLDFIHRRFIADGDLFRMVKNDAITGVTSNPAIFEKAMGHGEEYEKDIRKALSKKTMSAGEIYEHLAIEDIRAACDVMSHIYDRTNGQDGYVSFEVEPHLADNFSQTVKDASRLWHLINRKNLMIKIPATEAGIKAMKVIIKEGINVNATLLFSVEIYKKVIDVWMEALEERVEEGKDISHIASVASFFVSRLDTIIDKKIDSRLLEKDDEREALIKLRGRVAIANAQLAYDHLKSVLASPRWQKLQNNGASIQRLLWASTSTKDEQYSDVKYVQSLIGEHTVDTMSLVTLDAFRYHGKVKNTLPGNVEDARYIMQEAERLGFNMTEICQKLLNDGCEAFNLAFRKLLGVLEMRRISILGDDLIAFSASVSDTVSKSIIELNEQWQKNDTVRRIWEHDPNVWTGNDEAEWLGWLTAPRDGLLEKMENYQALARAVEKDGFTDILLLGMGGSSLGPDVLSQSLKKREGWPELHVLDTTDPEQILNAQRKVTLEKTLFIVATKSGSTLEPNILFAYFWDQMKKVVSNPGAHFIAVTDPGSSMVKTAQDYGFKQIFYGNPQIGGRYSVLSPFGMVAAAAAGYDVKAILESAEIMVKSCDGSMSPEKNLGVQLGFIIAEAALKEERNKVTFIRGGKMSSFGIWLEQLVAESTGKHGKGLIPIVGEIVGTPQDYGRDRVFIDVLFKDEKEMPAVKALKEAGMPVITLHMTDEAQIGQLFFIFEFAISVVGAVMGINAFDQPDVEFSKVETRKIISTYSETQTLPNYPSFAIDDEFVFYTAKTYEAEFGKNGHDIISILKSFFKLAKAGDYFALLAYIDRNAQHEKWAQDIQMAVRDTLKIASCAEFGPRYLHSTGQAYKGGPNIGLFLEVTVDDPDKLPVPGEAFSFSIVEEAQARGDLEVLEERHIRALGIHIKGSAEQGLKKLGSLIADALKGM